MLPSLRSLGLLAALLTTVVSLPSSSHNDVLAPREEKKDKPKTPKYFHEPGGSLARLHYDSRFFADEVPYGEHTGVLRDLIRSYLDVLGRHGAETWLAHGTLLGWWWNGAVMPWDYDLDVQVSNGTLAWMAEAMNRTEHEYVAESMVDGTRVAVTKRYLLDINPHQGEIDRGDGMNIIDARWIDMQNGMFVDITGVREREVEQLPGVWSCKNKHRYDAHDLWPMRVTEFEGVKAIIPYNYQKVLSDEYGEKSLVAEQWKNHRWDRQIKQWVAMSPREEEAAKQAAIAIKVKGLKAKEQQH